jgi:hypothetical protein
MAYGRMGVEMPSFTKHNYYVLVVIKKKTGVFGTAFQAFTHIQTPPEPKTTPHHTALDWL